MRSIHRTISSLADPTASFVLLFSGRPLQGTANCHSHWMRAVVATIVAAPPPTIGPGRNQT
jgi:hypothetical protein